ncbi:MAG: polyprenyl synthetase family protein [bacterium]
MQTDDNRTAEMRSYLADRQSRVDTALDRYLPRDDTYPEILGKAMRYSVFSGGKRFRPVLAIASFECCGGTGEAIVPVACAIEMIHAYSLIHDDLPCMDDDDLRRGKPTSHKVFGEAVAVLAGDALLSYAVEIVLTEGVRLLGAERAARVLGDLVRAAGPGGMVAGQVADILSQGKPAQPDTVRYIHSHKTGALIASSARCGAVAAGAIDSVVERMSAYGMKVGMAFQITDDVLDVEGTFGGMKSGSGLDQAKQKMTYPAAVGLDRSKADASRLVEEAKEAVSHLGEAAAALEYLADLVVRRSS